MQFMVTAMDLNDPEALERRMANREAHLAAVQEMIAAGQFLSGGAILDEAGRMVGSTLHLEFPDRAALEAHLRADPYVSGRVWDWERLEIRQVKLVPLARTPASTR